jgi:predicted DCC family thiol-disulfide oxidoreductase YuxK
VDGRVRRLLPALCIRTATQLDALDGGKRLRYGDLEREWARAAELVPGVSQEDMRAEMAEVTPEGGVSRGFYACREISKRLLALWVLMPVLFAPGAEWAGTRVYARVAANRARRRCDGESCAVHGAHAAEEGSGSAAVIEFGGSAS